MPGRDQLPSRWRYDNSSKSFSREESAALGAIEQITATFEGRHPEGGWVPDQLLQFKWGYLDGDLARWTGQDLEEILLQLMPRKVSLEPGDIAEVVPLTGAFLTFLDEVGVLSGEPLPRLLRTLDRIGERFGAEMANPANFGMAKSLIGGLMADGVDVSDPAALQAAMDDFNARPYDERAALIPGPSRTTLPAIVLPDEQQLAETARHTAAFQQVLAFLDFVGDGRPLTQKGNLRLADGRELVDLLDTDDVVDEQIGERVFRTTTTTELVEVDLVFRLALRARLARRYRGRVLVTTRGRRAAAAPLSTWQALADALVSLGMVTLGLERGFFYDRDLDEQAVASLLPVAMAGEPLAVAELADRFLDVLSHIYDLSSLPDTARKWLPDGTQHAMSQVVDRWDWLGVVEREGAAESWEYGRRRRRGGTVALTTLGWWFLRPELEERGVDVPVLGPLTDEDAPGLLARLVACDEVTARAQVAEWGESRPDPVGELLEVLTGDQPDHLRRAAVAVLDALGEPAFARMLALRADPDLAPWVDVFLLDRGTPPDEVFGTEHSPAAHLRALTALLLSSGPGAVVEAVSSGIGEQGQVEDIEAFWRIDTPYTDAVLEAAAASGSKPIAKAARKSLFKRRSART